jgi:hypothetical protein
MLLYNLGYQWNPANSAQPHGTILHAAGCPADSASSRELPLSSEGFTLLDPDSYLWGLSEDDCDRAAENLRSYPWLPDDIALGAVESLPDDAVRGLIDAAAAWQINRGASRVLLPAPLISGSEDSVEQFLRWADVGAEVAKQSDRPALISLGISDVALGAYFETVLDHLTARAELPGVYAFVETSRSSGGVAVSRDVATALLKISYFVGLRLGREVVVNYADSFGLACLSVGAIGFGAGYEAKARQLDFKSYEQRRGGGPFPRLFALGTTTYLRMDDLQNIRDRRLLWMLNSERTEASSSLLEALEAGRSAEDVPEWREARNNVSGARSHLTQRLASAVDGMDALPDLRNRVHWTLDWLQNCERDVAYFERRFEDSPLDDDGRHAAVWRASYEAFVRDCNIL